MAVKPQKTRVTGVRPDFATLVGLLIAAVGIVGGLLLEGGSIQEILAPTALLIVLGGTAGAVMVTTPMSVLLSASRKIYLIFFDQAIRPEQIVEEVIGFAAKARKSGIVSLEQDADEASHPFLRKALMLAIDGNDLQEIRKMMEIEISMEEHYVDAEARVFESAGGYAPTIGIIGAVMGLIQVMKHLDNLDEVGRGIATAFVATIYGVGFANVFFLPAGAKIKARAEQSARMKELMLEGVVGIVEGLNPKVIRGRLDAYIHGQAEERRGATGRRSGPE
ncbi:MAG: flagellar motor protein [Bryobacteraceae bacterium]